MKRQPQSVSPRSPERLVHDLRALGIEIEEGDHVAVGLSFKSIGHLTGGPEALIDSLAHAVGTDPHDEYLYRVFQSDGG